MCLDGIGYLRICKELTKQGRKDSTGNIKWSTSKISRILHNKTYCGYKCYKKSETTSFITHSRVKNLDKDSYVYVKGDWEAIVSEEDWNKVQAILAEKTKTIQERTNGSGKNVGKPLSKDIWTRKLRCSCGSSYRKNKWRTNKSGEDAFGYQCYNQVNNGAASTRLKAGLSAEGYCGIKMVADWKLECMAKTILEELWTDRQDAVEIAIKMIQDNYTEDTSIGSELGHIKKIEGIIDKYKHRLQTLLEMRMDKEISKEEYLKTKSDVEVNVEKLQKQLEQSSDAKNVVESIDEKRYIIRKALEEQIDFSGNIVSHDIIDKVVAQITPMSNNKFKWTLNLLGDNYNVVAFLNGRKNNPSLINGSEKDLYYFQPSSGGIDEIKFYIKSAGMGIK
jgi:uncharacterized protein YdaT